MKDLYRVLCGLWIFMMASCAGMEQELPLPEEEEGDIVLSVSTGITSSRADNTIAANELETAIDSLDIFVLAESDSKIKHYERIRTMPPAPGKVSLRVKKNDFQEGASYRVYVIANARASERDFQKLETLEDLRKVQVSDYRIQVTGGQKFGAIGPTITGVPGNFLMDGLAKRNNPSPMVLNDGTSEKVSLYVVLKRAAAKVVVKLRKGNSGILFDNCDIAKEEMGYSLRNMPYSTSMLEYGVPHEVSIRRTDFIADASGMFFHWTDSLVTIACYVYAYAWESTEFFDKGTRMMVNLPVKMVNEDNTTSDYHDSYYQVLLTKNNKFERNTYYEVNATIDAPGAIDHTNPEVLENLTYSAREWTDVNLQVGADNKPKYLRVNKDTLDMHYIVKDSTSLRFVSSSAVSVKVLNAYYIDKLGKQQNINASTTGIVITPDAGLVGNIQVKSPLPTNNAIRYINLEVANKDGSTKDTVLVRQYPLEYITNIQAWYSYRSDFGGTTYESQGTDRYVAATGWNQNNETWTKSSDQSKMDNALFGSKVVKQQNSDGTSVLHYYYWNRGWGASSYSIATKAGNLSSLKNARMYHVRITSTSPQYRVGVPRQTIKENETITINGVKHYAHYTETSEENNLLVSPSFMIASQLGATQSPGSLEQAASHCANYVEVYQKDGQKIHLTNWRLPTRAEVEIIMKFQYVPNAAMDEVLSGKYYWSAAGTVHNTGAKDQSSTQTAVRCVRDAY